MRTSVKKVKKANMYVLTTWVEEKQGVKQSQEWYNSKEEAEQAQLKVIEEHNEQTT